MSFFLFFGYTDLLLRRLNAQIIVCREWEVMRKAALHLAHLLFCFVVLYEHDCFLVCFFMASLSFFSISLWWRFIFRWWLNPGFKVSIIQFVKRSIKPFTLQSTYNISTVQWDLNHIFNFSFLHFLSIKLTQDDLTANKLGPFCVFSHSGFKL